MKTVLVCVVGLLMLAALPLAAQPVLQLTPGSIDFPAWGPPGTQKDTIIQLTNPTANDITVAAIGTVELSSTLPSTPLWLAVAETTPLTVPAGQSGSLTVQLNKAGIICFPPVVLRGLVVLSYSPPETRTDTLSIVYTVADTVSLPLWDTLQTACLSLAVVTNGNFGNRGNNSQGGVNMNFSPPLECDTGTNSRGQANIYLYDGSPVILRKTATDIVASWAIFDDGFETENGFKPLAGFAEPAFDSSNAHFDAFTTGTFCTVDSLVRIEKTWYAPKGMVDSCQFILQKMLVYPYTLNSAVPGLAIGEAIDWDVPSDSGSNGGFIKNIGGSNATKNMVWLRGFNSADGISDCADNSLRYAGMATLRQHLKNCQPLPLHGAYTQRMDSFVYPAGNFVPSELWEHMRLSGFHNSPGTNDQYGVLIYQSNGDGSGWTLPANDTLTVWSVLATTYQGGLADVTAQIDMAYRFLKDRALILGDECLLPRICCQGDTTGNVNVAGIVDGGDLALLVAYLTNPPLSKPTLPCPGEANVNAVGIIDGGDLALLVAYLTNPPESKPALPLCPDS